ncbi:XRE family transcriptional regulator [Streptomyces europaeiscabiei]|uniref:XRE family transcriptional regulator n=1 Tax=Streptomyces europaeiscabiei TaxID=146819 RepID=A0ABU4NHC0_9ACTN|nr:XRE family transcriptional regulator [Streptomyces europaeiscabiei]MDX2762945.1 XRE family transcriptional regulator [Streptomyces europaeiscabiei]MDX3544588.1 XRE family transcriptional regulator [Streptomyces europaeiscabiei]MDX3553938.1 XRE family transcriptional regulator [Streptomyces europaeiscabiei]MDX3702056.1 XRE family transcriptional regulator [Streptomyces europaeiscabiei]
MKTSETTAETPPQTAAKPVPNSKLRAVRMGLLMSQDDFARAIREAGAAAGEPNDASKRLVQRWEAGTTGAPRPVYARALERVTRLPIDSLGFAPVALASVQSDGQGGHDLEPSTATAPVPTATAQTATRTPNGNYSGIWLSRYEFFSSGRDETFTGLHYVVLLQHGNKLTVRSLPDASLNPNSPLTMDLTLDGNVVTGTWVEETATEGYYAGARYHGAVQMLIEPTGRRMVGKWLGFGKEFDVNTGPWTLEFKDASTNKAALEKWNVQPEA